jgi:hypothetical protein
MSAVIDRVLENFRPHTLDVIRIFGHGSDRPDPGSDVATIQFGTGLDVAGAEEFGRIRHLWRNPYVPHLDARAHTTDADYRFVTPRIEVHSCFATLWGTPVLRRLARVTHAPVFATGVLQVITTTQDNLNFEGTVFRFNPF